MQWCIGRGVEQEGVARGAGVAASVGRRHEQRQRPVLELLAHLRYALAVAAAAVVHTFAFNEFNKFGTFSKNIIII